MDNTPDFFLGARLGAARIKAGISLEKAAKDTRIRVMRLREIEADDFSGFAHPTYSRLFLLDYAEYLGIPLEEIRPLLPDRTGAAGGGFQYIEALSRNPSSPVSPMRSKRPGLFAIFLAVGLLILLTAAGFFTYFTIKKIERVARSAPISSGTEVPKEVATPTPDASPEETPASEPTPEAFPPPQLPADHAPNGNTLWEAVMPPSSGSQMPTPAPIP